MDNNVRHPSERNVENPAIRTGSLTLRRAALIAGVSYILMPVGFTEGYVFPKLIITDNIEQTVQNIASHQALFFIGILCHFVTMILDVIIAWALYVLLAPVNRALSLLTGRFRLIYAANYLSGLSGLLLVLRLLKKPYYETIFGSQQLHAQIQLLLGSFQSSLSLAVFGIHLGLVGYLIFKSGYIPKLLGIILFMLGVGWIVYCIGPYLYPQANLGFFPLAAAGELLLPLWLLIRGSKIKEPAA